MNFHKTIGFLVTLLLTLGLGVPDSFAQTAVTTAQVKTLSLTFDPSSMNEGDGQRSGKLAVTVTLKATATEDRVATVSLRAGPAAGNTIDLNSAATDDVVSALSLADLTVNIANGSDTGTAEVGFTYDPQEDDNNSDETYVVQGRVGGSDNNKDPSATFTVMDNEVRVSSLGLAFDPPSMNEGDGQRSGKLVVTVTLEGPATADDHTETVTLRAGPAAGNTIDLTTTGTEVISALTLGDLTVSIAKGSTTGTAEVGFTYDPSQDDGNNADETYVVQGRIGGADNNRDPKATFTVRDMGIRVSSLVLAFDPSSMNEGDGQKSGKLVVTVTLEGPAAEDRDEIVTLSAGPASGNTIDLADAGTDDVVSALDITTPVTVSIRQGATSSTAEVSFDYDPQEDNGEYDNETYVVRGSVGTNTASATFTVMDNDIEVSSLDLAFDPPSMNEGDGQRSGKLVVTVTLEGPAVSDQTETVTLRAGPAAGNTIDLTTTGTGVISALTLGDLTVDIAKGSATGTAEVGFTYDPQEDDTTVDETYVVQGRIGGTDNNKDPSATFTVMDTGNGVSSLVLAFDPSSMNEGDGQKGGKLVVTVTLQRPAAADRTETVSLRAAASGNTINLTDDSTDDVVSALSLADLTVNIAKDSATGTAEVGFTYNPPQDDGNTVDETYVVQGRIGGADNNKDPKATFKVVDKDVAGAVTSVVLSPDMFPLTEGAAFSGTVTVTVNVAAGLATTHNVVLTATGAVTDVADLGITSPVTVAIQEDATSGMETVSISYTPPDDSDSADEMITITGMVGTVGGDNNTATLTVADNDPGTVESVVLSPAMLSATEEMAFSGTVTVTVNVAAGAATTHNVDLTATGLVTDVAGLGITSPVAVSVEHGATSGMETVSITYEQADDGNTVDEMITITGMVGTVGGDNNTATITVADNDASAVESVVLSPDTFTLTEEMAFTGTVTVTVNVAAGAATTHTVNLSSSLPTGSITPAPVMVEVGHGATSGMETVSISYTPPDDSDTTDETITITGSVGGQSDMVTLTVVDNDAGAVSSVTFSSTSFTLTEGVAFSEMVTVTVNVAAGAATTHSVALTAAGAVTDVADLGITSPVMVDIPKGATSGMATVSISYTPPEDTDSADPTPIVITGTVGTEAAIIGLVIQDNDPGAVTGLTLEPAEFDLTEGVAFSGTVNVTVNVVAGAAETHTVNLSSSLPTGSITPTPVMVSVGHGATSGMATVSISYTPPEDSDTLDGTMTITGSIGGNSDTVTLAIADNDKQAIKISTNLESIRENSRTRSVVVTATLPAAPGAGNTVTVNIMVRGGAAPVPATITIVGTDRSGTTTVQITPVNDEVFTTSAFTVTGSATGYVDGTEMIDIIDDDASLGTLTVTSAPPSATLGGGAQDLTLTVKVVLASPDTPIPSSLVVNVSTDKGTLASPTVTITNTRKHPDHDPATRKADGTATVVLSLAAGDVNAAGNINVTASANMYETGTREIPIRARGALDVAGYRAVISKPTGTAWANVGNDKIFVDVTRFANVAYPWTDFESIKVSVRDTAHAAFELEQVTASGFNREDNGSVTFLEPGSPSRGDVIWRGNDTIRFEIRIRAHSAYSSQDRADNGQYMGAYAHVEFTSGSDTEAIETRDDETSVYAANPSLVNDAKVGDGRLIRIDNLAPTHSGVADIVVTSGDEVGSDIDATVGDEIRVAVALSQTNLFRETGLRIQLQVVDGTGTVNGQLLTAAQRNNPSKNKDFTTSQVIAAANDSLIHTYKVTEGFFTITLDDFVEDVGAKGAKLDLNNARARVRAGVRDQAANFTWFGWTTFDIDSRSPSVSILYPSADPDSIYEHTHPMRFSGAFESVVEGQNVDAHLHPLAILVDEDLSSLKVYAVGADTLDITGQMPSDVIGDSMAVYDTSDLSSPKKDGEGDDDKYPGAFVPSSANRAGTAIDLAVLATDVLGNTTKTTISGVTHDASPPVITEWFPKNSLLPEDQINDATPPIFTVPEDVDSIAVTFEGSDGADVTKQRGAAAKGEHSIDFSGALEDEVLYDMTIFVRDLAGNVFITPADSSSSMRFNAQFDNPVANRYNISTETDSVIAGQANILTIQAEDHNASSNTTRKALTYKNAVRISAWDASGGAAESVWFEGTGVTDDADNPDGEAMLNAADWSIGKRSVTVKSNKATGFIKILAQHISSGQGDTAVLGFESAKDSLYVGAADFAAFDITAWEEGVEGAAEEIWGDYTLRVVPTDRHGNPSVRAFKSDPASAEDSLAVLDTWVGDNAFEYKDGIDVEIVGVPTIEDFALLILSIGKEGANYDLVAPDDRRSQTVQVRVVNGSLKEGDTRSQNVRSSARFVISEPLTPVLTVRVEGMEGDQAGNDVVVPATVTVAAEGYNAGDMVTFTRNGQTVGTIRANDEGVATAPPISVNMAGMAIVSATNGRYATDALTITFVDTPPEPARKSYVDADGNPVYLISDADMTVGVDDFLALVAAFGSSDGDANYNAQADVNDDGMVGVADFLEFLTSWGRTAAGPATKPLVLLPGINENAEFSLSLGSERVVAGELVAVDVSLDNVAELIGYGFALNYETDKFEFVSVAPADEDLLKSTGGETLFHHIVSDGQITVANGLYNGTAVSGGGDVVRFVFRVLREFEDNARFEVADGLVFDPSQLSNPAVVAGVLELQSTPREFALHQNFPNPFNPDTTIKYDLAESADVTLQIYNVLGQVVRTLVASEAQNAGRYQIRWNGMDDRGVPVSSGIYFYQISADGKFSDVRKLMLLK